MENVIQHIHYMNYAINFMEKISKPYYNLKAIFLFRISFLKEICISVIFEIIPTNNSFHLGTAD